MTLAGVILATVYFTLPAYKSGDSLNLCEADSVRPLENIVSVQLYGWPRFVSGSPSLLVSKDVRGQEGRPDSLTFDDGGQVWTVYVTTIDNSGYESCPSNMVTLNATTGVEPPPAAFGLVATCPPGSGLATFAWVSPAADPAELAVFDLTGRLVARCARVRGGIARWSWDCSGAGQGVYFARLRAGGRVAVRRFAVIR